MASKNTRRYGCQGLSASLKLYWPSWGGSKVAWLATTFQLILALASPPPDR